MAHENDSQEQKPSGMSSFGDISLLRTYYNMETADPLSIIQFCQNYGLIGTQYICPWCAQPMKLGSRPDSYDKLCWRCHCNGRNTKRSLRNGTWFAKSNIPIPTILFMTCAWINKMPLEAISHQSEVSLITVTNWISHCRDICFEILAFAVGKLGGPGLVVEIHVLKFIEHKYSKVKRRDGQWVYAGYERKTGHCFLEPVEKCTPEILFAIISEHILPGTTLMSDSWEAYDTHEGFHHLKVNNNLTFLDLEMGMQTDGNKGSWNAMKKSFHNTNKTKNQFDSSFAEHVWLRSSVSPVEKMLSFFKTCAELYPPQVQDSPEP